MGSSILCCRKNHKYGFLIFLMTVLSGLFLGGNGAFAQSVSANAISAGDTAWVLISSALVMLMLPGLSLFYGGMVRGKNVLGTIMHSMFALVLVSLIWALYGYSLTFGTDWMHFIGGLKWIGLRGVGFLPNVDYAPTIPHEAFMVFQMMFAAITVALISGAFAERFKFKAYVLFVTLWITFVYCPLAHWVWGIGGWIRTMGALDFAGGLVVHISSGAAALACALVIGKRRRYGRDPMQPHNLVLTIIGGALLWFGWFGFNAGSALSVGPLAASAFVVTHLATAAAALSWMCVEWFHRGKPTALGMISGAVAGLVAITPASGYVGPMPAIIIGLVGGALCYGAVGLKTKLRYDDSLDAVGVHGVGGIWGALATGLFASKLINSAGADGFFHGNPHLVLVQIISIVTAVVYSFVLTYIILKLIDKTVGIRVSDDEEVEGLDISQHGERGYTS